MQKRFPRLSKEYESIFLLNRSLFNYCPFTSHPKSLASPEIVEFWAVFDRKITRLAAIGCIDFAKYFFYFLIFQQNRLLI